MSVMIKENNTIFDNWEDVNNCLKCEHLHNSTCDGVKVNGVFNENTPQTPIRPPCGSFTPTLRYFIELNEKDAQNGLKRLWWAFGILATFVGLDTILLLWILFGG